MRVKIENDRVHQNVLIFLELASRVKDKLPQRSHAALINRVNGEIYFIELMPNAQVLRRKDWKRIELSCLSDPKDAHLSIEVAGNEPSQAFDCEDLTPLAYRVMTETIRTLNHIVQSVKQAEGFDQVEVQAFSQDLIQATWHDADRIEAEDILEKHPYGSYLFRCDEYAQMLGEHLSRQLQRKIDIYTLTFSEPIRKVSDLTIVNDQGRFLIYNDDPSLSGMSYASVEEILSTLGLRCRIPIFH